MKVDVEDLALTAKSAGKGGEHNIYMLRCSVDDFIAPGYWMDFPAIRDRWVFDDFSRFCNEWLRMPEDSLRKLFRGDPVAMAILNEAKLKRTVSRKQAEDWAARVEAGESFREIGREEGVAHTTVVRQVVRKNSLDNKNAPPKPSRTQYKISQYTTPETAAMKIREKFGDDWADTAGHSR